MERPKYFFKFRRWRTDQQVGADGVVVSRNYTEELLRDGVFFCSSPWSFDDPHDNDLGAMTTGGPRDIERFIFGNIGDIVRASRLTGSSNLIELSQSEHLSAKSAIRNAAQRKARRDSRVLCFSEAWDDELMWAFYADNHRGLCLVFDAQHEFFASAQRVHYVHSPVEAENMKGPPDPYALVKSTAWAFQREWRMVLKAAEAAGDKLAFPRGALKAVIFGYRCLQSQIEEVTRVLVRGQYRVSIEQMQRVPGVYALFRDHLRDVGPEIDTKTPRAD
jgi:Protein of unknown function (DUF2971)